MGGCQAPGHLNAALAAWLPQPGSEIYYAQLYTPAAQRRTLSLLEGLRSAITRIPATCSSPAVALPKLAWWREELGRCARGTPRHPLTQSLVETAPPTLVPAALALLSGIETMLGRADWSRRTERRAALAAAQGPLWEVSCGICLGDQQPPIEAMALAMAVEETWLLRDARRFIVGGLPLVARDLLPAPPERQPSPAQPGDWHAALLGADLALLEAELRAGLASLPHRKRLRPLATLAVLAIATASEVRAGGSRVWESRVELTPLRQFLLAWREARFAR